MANQHLKIIPCGKLSSQSKIFGLHIFENDDSQFVLREDPQTQIPLKLQAWSVPEPDAELWVCENQVFRVQDSHVVPEEELRLCIQHVALKEQKKLHRIQHEVQAHHSSKSSKRVIRERIPHDVRLYVWQRDQGKCVQCGSQEKLEYDHIIPVSRGGGNTDRISNYSAKSTIAKKVS